MVAQNDTTLFYCGSKNITLPIMLIIMTLVLHIPLLKVLMLNLRLELPRHKLVAGLSMSHCILTSIMSILIVSTSQLNSITDMEACLVLRRIGHFSFVSTTVINSVTISTLCFERYVACIHSFRFDEIFTSRRVSYGLLVAWLYGGALGMGNAIFSSISGDLRGSNIMIQIIVPVFVIPSSLIIVVVQLKLYMFSRKKMAQIVSVAASSSAAETAEFRRRQIKIAVVAGLTALLYLVCFLPVCAFMLLEMNGVVINSSTSRKVIFGLRFINSVVDPFLYGLRIVDTREGLVKDFRRIKGAIITLLMSSLSKE